MEPDPLASAPHRVEAYLDQVLAPLTRSLSSFHRDELRRELRAHLWGRVDAYRELGHLEDEAVTEALRQFGGAKDFTRQWQREWMQATPKLTLREVREAGLSALPPTLMGLAGAVLPFGLLAGAFHHLQTSSPAHALLESASAAIFWALAGFACVGLPALVGARQGQQAPKHAGIGMLAALTVESVTVSLMYQFVDWAVPGASVLDSLFSGLLMVIASWVPIACSSAAISGWWRRHSKTRLLA